MSPNPRAHRGIVPRRLALTDRGRMRVLYKREHFLGHDDLKFVAAHSLTRCFTYNYAPSCFHSAS